MDMKGDVYNNWNFFPAEWENDKIAIGQDEKDEKIWVATLLIIMGKECLQLQRHLHMQDADREDSAKIIDALQKHYEPNRNVIHCDLCDLCLMTANKAIVKQQSSM